MNFIAILIYISTINMGPHWELSKPEPIVFRSLGNDQADVHLILDLRGRMTLHYSGVESNRDITYRGRWEEEDGFYEISFSRFKHINLRNLLIGGHENNKIEIVGKRKLNIPDDAQGVALWGIYCERLH